MKDTIRASTHSHWFAHTLTAVPLSRLLSQQLAAEARFAAFPLSQHRAHRDIKGSYCRRRRRCRVVMIDNSQSIFGHFKLIPTENCLLICYRRQC